MFSGCRESVCPSVRHSPCVPDVERFKFWDQNVKSLRSRCVGSNVLENAHFGLVNTTS